MVTVYSCRDTADKQTIFTETNRKTIKDVRCSLFEVCGTSENMKEDLPLSAVHDTDKFLGVSTVVIEQDSVDITSKKVIEDVLQTSEAIRFDESSVSFNPETVYHSILRPLSWRIPQQQSTVLEEWYCAVTL